MMEDIKKGLYAGIGVALLTKDRIERFREKLVNEAKLSREEAQRLTDELVKSGEEQWTEFENRCVDTAKKGIGSFDLARRSELESLKERVDNLEKRIVLMEETKPVSGAE
jgi:polyhydroxyalkanoate synthesis regulator phasin